MQEGSEDTLEVLPGNISETVGRTMLRHMFFN